MKMYHLTQPLLAVGSIILPGNFGRIVRLYGPAHTHWLRESAIEAHRIYLKKGAPSRLDCVFCFDNEASAHRFRSTEQGFQLHTTV